MSKNEKEDKFEYQDNVNLLYCDRCNSFLILAILERCVNEVRKYRVNPDKIEISFLYKVLFEVPPTEMFGIPVKFSVLERNIIRIEYIDPTMSKFMATDYKFGYFVEIKLTTEEMYALDSRLADYYENKKKEEYSEEIYRYDGER